MIVSKAYLKILKKLIPSLFIFVAVTVFFTVLSVKDTSKSEAFIPVNPNVLLVNLDEDSKIIDNFKDYLSKKTKLTVVKEIPKDIDDAIFFEDYKEVIYLNKGFTKSFQNKKLEQIDIKNSNSYSSIMTDMVINNYLNRLNYYLELGLSEDEVINSLNRTFNEKSEVSILKDVDTNQLVGLGVFYKILNYTFISNSIYFIAFILNKFNEEKRKNRQLVSKTPFKKILNRLFICNSLFTIGLWFLFVVISLLLLGSIAYSKYGLWMMITSFVFIINCMSLGFLVASLVKKEEPINMIQNIYGLATSFLCGAFVPLMYLPKFVVTIAKLFPSYWYVDTIDFITKSDLKEGSSFIYIGQNLLVITIFTIIFYLVTQYVNKRKV